MDCDVPFCQDGVTVSALTVADAKLPTSWWGVLCAEEKKRAEAFQFQVDRDSYVAAHALLRWRLSEVTELAARDLRFVYDDFGKLTLESGGETVAFSLSHTRGMVAVAISHYAAVGVDVEAMNRPVTEAASIADSYFTPDEVAAFKLAPEGRSRNELFVHLWTRKEAVLKATGRGLGLPLASFSVVGNGNRTSIPETQQEAPFGFAIASRRFGTFDVAAAVVLKSAIPPRFSWREETSRVPRA